MTSGTPTIGKALAQLPAGVFRTINKVKPSGALQARKQASGAVTFYWRFSIGAVSQRVSIGVYDSSAPPKSLEPTARGYSVAAATRSAESLSLEHVANKDTGGFPALKAAKLKVKMQEAQDKAAAGKYTLQNLMWDYANHLESLGRKSCSEVRSLTKLHVVEACPDTAALPASQVTSEQIADMLRVVIGKGKGRTANKLRSYLRAAYQTARAARTKASIPVQFKSYNVGSNPAADTEPDSSQNKTDKHPLSAEALRAYWNVINDLSGFKGAVLRLHLLTGGQRIEQLVNLLRVNVHKDRIVLLDGKGRPGAAPREHTVPLIPAAAIAMKECLDGYKAEGPFAISTGMGVTHLAATQLSAWAVEAASGIDGFKAKHIRSGVETYLASAGVSMDIRGRLQSHGISGVQNKHYDGHDYLAEKRRALDALYEHINVKLAPKSEKTDDPREAIYLAMMGQAT